LLPGGRFQDLFDRFIAYPWWQVAIELAVIWLVVYVILRFVQGTRAAGALKGIFVIFLTLTVIARIVGGSESFQRLGFLYEKLLTLVALGLVVIFQPELRRALIRVGEASFFRSTPGEIANVVDAITHACGYLSKARFGGLIVLERQAGLEELVEGGIKLEARVSSELLQTIFFPSTALHDLAVVIKGRVLDAAGVQLPLADPADMSDPTLGSRHRAAVGLTKECDALVIVVSEETGLIRIAERGRLSEGLSADELRTDLLRRLRQEPPGRSAETAAEEAQTRIIEPEGDAT
jgi:diadenylate cyclase